MSLCKDDPSVGVLLFEKRGVVWSVPYISEKRIVKRAPLLGDATTRYPALEDDGLLAVEGRGIGVAINNRLRKASRKR